MTNIDQSQISAEVGGEALGEVVAEIFTDLAILTADPLKSREAFVTDEQFERYLKRRRFESIDEDNDHALEVPAIEFRAFNLMATPRSLRILHAIRPKDLDTVTYLGIPDERYLVTLTECSIPKREVKNVIYVNAALAAEPGVPKLIKRSYRDGKPLEDVLIEPYDQNGISFEFSEIKEARSELRREANALIALALDLSPVS